MDRLDQLIEAALDGTADAAAWDELGQHLQQPEGRRRVAEAMRICGGIAQLSRHAPRGRSATPWLLLAAGLILGLGLVGLLTLGGERPAPVARIIAAGPEARILGTQPRAAVAGQELVADEGLSGPVSFALPDGSEGRLSAAAELRFAATPGALALTRGRIEVQAAPQAPGQRLTVSTARLAASVHGTRFAVDIGPDDDLISVQEGRVQVVSAGQTRELAASEVLRSDGAALRTAILPPRNASYDLSAPTVPVTGIQHPAGLTPQFDHLAGAVRMHLLRVGEIARPLAAFDRSMHLGLIHDLPAPTKAVLVVGLVRTSETKGWVGNLRQSILLPAGSGIRTDWKLAAMPLANGEPLPELRGDEAIAFVMILTSDSDAGLRLRRIEVAPATPAMAPR